MRKFLSIAFVLSAALAGAWTFTAAAAAYAESFKLRIAASDGKPAANLDLFIGGETNGLGATNSAGELEIADDPSKNGKTFNVYRLACTRLVAHEVGTAGDKECEEQASSSSLGANGCRRCQKLGFFVFGSDATVGEFRGGNTTRNLTIGGLLAAAAVGGVVAATNGNGSVPAATTPAFANLSGTTQLNLNSNGGCPGFTATASPMLTLTIDPTTGVGSGSVNYGQTRTDYTNVRATREGNRIIVTGTGATVLTAPRNFNADFRAVYDVAQNGQVTLVEFAENFLQTTGVGSGCLQIFRR